MALFSPTNALKIKPHLLSSSKPNIPKLPNCPFVPSIASIPSLHVSAIPPSIPSFATSNPDKIIRSLCREGKLDEAISIFDNSPDFNFEEETYRELINLCGRKRAISEGYRVHTRITESETQIGLILGNALLLMHVKFEKLITAWTVFAKMPERDVFTWNVMINGYGQSGLLDDSLDLYQRMIMGGFRPDIYTFTCILRCCGGLMELNRGKETHAHVLRFQYGFEIDVSNALIAMYSKCGDLLSARKVFDEMPKRDCISFNSLIDGYFENHQNAFGIELFLSMLSQSIEPDPFTMTCVISKSKSKLGQNLHGYSVKKGFYLDYTVCNSLIKMYSDANQMGNANKIFSKIPEKNVFCYSSMISGFEQNGLSDEALKLFSQMESNNITPEYVTILSALSACSNLGNLDYGLKLHKIAKVQGLDRDKKISNALLEMYTKTRCIEQAMEVFKKNPKKDQITFTIIISGFHINKRNIDSLRFFRNMQNYIKPSDVTFLAALSACADLKAINCGKEIHARVLKLGFLGFNTFLSNSIMDLYAKCGNIKYAISQFSYMNLKSDIISYNILINGYAILGEGKNALEVFKYMVEIILIKPDDVTFVALLCAFSRSNMVTKGKEYFYKMAHEYNIIPNLKHYACMVDLLGRAGFLDEALDLIKGMDIKLKPDSAIWGALLNACRIHKNLELGEYAAKYLFELEDGEYLGYYTLYCKFYAEIGFWEGVDRVRKLMREKGVETNPGCSWVEIKGALHAFLTNDISHPQIEEINKVVKDLEEKIRVIDPFVQVEKSKKDVINELEQRIRVNEDDPVEKSKADLVNQLKRIRVIDPFYRVEKSKNVTNELEEKIRDDPFVDRVEKSKEDVLCGHSERLAIGFGLLNSLPGLPISVTKNLYMCEKCHKFAKLVSGIVRREISVRDVEKLHTFREGQCSCGG